MAVVFVVLAAPLTRGYHTIRLKANSKNAASTNYYLVMGGVQVR
jgi:hypothetical protein